MDTFVDSSKKRKTDDNGAVYADDSGSALTPDDARKILDPLSKDQLLDLLQAAVLRHSDVLDAVRAVADSDSAKRKLFVRGLGWETNTEKLKGIFSSFGEIEEAIVITDKVTGKSKGYGFVTFKHVDGAIVALRVPSKKIDGRMTVTQYASAGMSGGGGADVSMRKIYVGNVPFEISSERLLEYFSAFGEIEEGPLGFDKQTGKAKGFAFFVYKTEEGARNSLVDPMKTIDGHQVMCKLAVDGKKAKPAGPTGDDRQGGQQQPMPGSLNSGYGGAPGGYGGASGGYGGFSGGPLGNQNPYMNNSIPSAVGGAGFGNQGPSSFGGAVGGYGASFGSGGYGGSQYGGGASSEYGGPNSAGSMYRMPPTSAGMPSGGYLDSGNYGLPSSGGFPSQLNQPPPSGPRGPGGMYQGVPPYY